MHPGDETALNLFWINACKDTIEGVMRRDTRWKCKKRLKPCLLLIRNDSNLRKPICTTDGATNRHHDNFNEKVTFIVIFTIIRDRAKVCNQGLTTVQKTCPT